MDKLISMVDFVLEQYKIGIEVQSISHQLQNRVNRFDKIVNYAKFLKQPLTLGMFVPCDLDGNVMEEPKGIKCCGGIQNDCDCRGELQYDDEQIKEYQESKDRVLFDEWELVHNGKWGAEIARCKITGNNQFNITKYLSVEKLLNEKQLFLTESARKQIGL